MRDTASLARAHALGQLEAALLACRSATAVLERWVGQPISARRVAGRDKPLSANGAAALQLAPGEIPAYRRVELIAQATVLCIADNWYVPGRLTRAMNIALNETDQPFGRIVRLPGTHRRALSHDTPRVLSHDTPDTQAGILHLRALMLRSDGQALCLVDETYLTPLLDRPFPREIA